MRYSSAALVLATAFIGNVAAGPVHHAHQHFHEKKSELVDREAAIERRQGGLADVNWAAVQYTYSSGQTWGSSTPAPAPAPTTTSSAAPAPVAASPSSNPVAPVVNAIEEIATTLTSDAISFLASLGVMSAVTTTNSWVGGGGAWTADFHNNAGDDVILCVWGAESWVNTNSPSVLVTIPPGGMTTVSFANGQSGAWAGIYPDTDLRLGQVNNTWGEFSFMSYGAVDVSREVNMAGHPMSITTSNGCVTDMNNCVFVCLPGAGNSCWQQYQLDQSSNPNCIKGQDPVTGGDSGGCSLGQVTSGKITVAFS